MTVLLDASVLIAAAFEDHEHNDAADGWLADLGDTYATCPITQGALVRTAIRKGFTASDAIALLGHILAGDRHEFWPDDLGFVDVSMHGVIGHKQVTDAYLAELARERRGRIATLDQGLVALHSDVADLVPTS
ncbi:MAG: TA system VapC family ribonuclease toxin [Jatrophihabitans sp.]